MSFERAGAGRQRWYRAGGSRGARCAAAIAVLATVAALLVACRGGSSKQAATSPVTGIASAVSSPASGGSPAASAAAPCTPSKPHGNGSSQVTLASGRHYILHVPPSYDGAKPLALVVNLHGAGSNAAQEAFYTRFQTKADSEGFITVTPDALGTPQAWNFIPTPGGADDVGFIRDALDRTQADLCVDGARVYATGISSGAAMSVRLACSLQDRIAAIGIVAALWYPPGCPTAKPMPVLEFHGTDDPSVPFAGGTVANSGLPAPGVESAAAAWARADGCNARAAETRFAAHVRTLAYSECRGNVAVELFIVEGGGHTWPGAAADVTTLGATSHEVDATEQIWQFFVAHGG